jgi:hypothetical protein
MATGMGLPERRLTVRGGSWYPQGRPTYPIICRDSIHYYWLGPITARIKICGVLLMLFYQASTERAGAMRRNAL